MKLLDPDFGMAQPRLLQPSRSRTAEEKDLSLSVFLSVLTLPFNYTFSLSLSEEQAKGCLPSSEAARGKEQDLCRDQRRQLLLPVVSGL